MSSLQSRILIGLVGFPSVIYVILNHILVFNMIVVFCFALAFREFIKIVRNFKKFDKNKPIILMGYYNMIFQYGDSNFLKKCKTSGVNGLIVVDLPWPENKDFAKKCKKKSIYFIQLLLIVLIGCFSVRFTSLGV